MKRVLLLLTLIGVLSSCKKEVLTEPAIPKTESPEFTVADFAGKVFKISQNFNPKECNVYSDGCDCCEGHIIFLNDGTFIEDFYCIPDDLYGTGKYSIEKGKMKLVSDEKSIVIHEAFDGDENDKDSVYVEILEPNTTFLKIITCKGQFIMQSQGEDEQSCYGEDKTLKLSEAIGGYKEKGVYRMLGIKE